MTGFEHFLCAVGFVTLVVGGFYVFVRSVNWVDEVNKAVRFVSTRASSEVLEIVRKHGWDMQDEINKHETRLGELEAQIKKEKKK